MTQFEKDMKQLGFSNFDDPTTYTIINRNVAAYKDCSDDERDDEFYEMYQVKFNKWASPIIVKVKDIAKKHNVKINIERSTPNGMVIIYV